jgi:hypothetical protein
MYLHPQARRSRSVGRPSRSANATVKSVVPADPAKAKDTVSSAVTQVTGGLLP